MLKAGCSHDWLMPRTFFVSRTPWTDSVGIHHCLEFTLRPYGGRNRGLGRCPGSILTWVKRFRMCWLKYLPLDSAFSNS